MDLEGNVGPVHNPHFQVAMDRDRQFHMPRIPGSGIRVDAINLRDCFLGRLSFEERHLAGGEEKEKG